MKNNKKINTLNFNDSSSTHEYEILVFSHIRWDWIYHRPQHIIKRLSKTCKILYIEEPIQNLDDQHQMFEISSNLHILQPCILDIDNLSSVLVEYLGTSHIKKAWFYSSNFNSIFNQLSFDQIIYDSSEELSISKGASQQLINREHTLLSRSDIIFVSGERSYLDKVQKYQNVHYFPNSVDFEHFNQSNNGILIPPDTIHITSPIVGYFGILDERINYTLLQQTAFLLPTISFVLIGPVVDISVEDLPKEKNIHYLGSRSYNYLPHYLKVFDIAMMPFRINEHSKTSFPLKMLEYMTGGIPIISTPINDVVNNFSHCIRIVESCDDFVKEINLALKDKEKKFLKDYEVILNGTSWDNTVKKMELLIYKNELETT